jgi:hypothetical protein
MLENKLLVSFLIGLVITLIYYYISHKSNEEDNYESIGIYLTIFIFILIITYLIQIGYISNKKSGGSVSENIIDGGQSYKAPF